MSLSIVFLSLFSFKKSSLISIINLLASLFLLILGLSLSTGFASGGATVQDVAIMRKVVGSQMGVKASGGIRDTETAEAMIQAGANRIGASASVKIVGG